MEKVEKVNEADSRFMKYQAWIRRLVLTAQLYKHRVPMIVTTTMLLVSVLIGSISFYHIARLFMEVYREGSAIRSGEITTIGFIGVILSMLVIASAWLLSTRTHFYTKPRMKGIAFIISLSAAMSVILWYGESRFYLYVIPIFELMLTDFQSLTETDEIMDQAYALALSQRKPLYILILLMPILFVSFIFYFFIVKFHAYEVEIKKAFKQFKWRGKWLQLFEWMEETEYYPHIYLGYDIHTNEMVRLFGIDRTLNSIINGAIGTGKSAALAESAINKDFDHMVKFINEFPTIYEQEDYFSQDVSGKYLNGVTVIDPSNDLCKNVYEMAKAHGIPDEAITYIDPTNENTPSFNPLRGPTDKVAEVFAEVISGLSNETGNDFFAQAARNHLKQFIYLLKEHNPNEDVTFDMLIQMYDRPEFVHELHEKLKRRMPAKITREAFSSRDEYNYWDIMKGIDAWFDVTIVPMRDRNGVIQLDTFGNPIWVDAEAEYVKGLRNQLKDLASNILIRRVLFGKSEFDFDRHFAVGGVLLVNTAKGQLSHLSRVLGKFMLLNLQNAAFRREPRKSTYHHIVVDESPEYLYPQFVTFPTQSRKYKIILTILMQTYSQLEHEFGETYKDTILAAMRQKMFYGDATGKDAKAFSEIIGETLRFKEGESEMETAAIQDDPSNRTNASYQRQVEAFMSANELIFREAFQCTVRLTDNNTPQPAKVIKANFVSKKEKVKARFRAHTDATAYWLEKRREFGKQFAIGNETLKSVDTLEQERTELIEQLGLLSQKERGVLEQEQIKEQLHDSGYAVEEQEPAPPYEQLQDEAPPSITPPLTEKTVSEPMVKQNEVAEVPLWNMDDLFGVPSAKEPVVEPVENKVPSQEPVIALYQDVQSFMQPIHSEMNTQQDYIESALDEATEKNLKEIFEKN